MHFFLLSLLLTLNLRGFETQATQASRSSISIEFDVARAASLHQPVVFWYSIRNDTMTAAKLDLGYDRIGDLTFNLIKPTGGRKSVSPSPPPWDSASRDPVVGLSPGQSYRRSVVLDNWLDFDEIGTYQLSVKFNGRILLGAAEVAINQAGWRIDLSPRDPKLLEARCADLVNFLTSTSTRDEIFTAYTNELVWMRDPVAVRYHEAVLAAGVGPMFFDSLVAIGTPEARDAIVRLTTNNTDWIASNAKAALKRFQLRK